MDQNYIVSCFVHIVYGNTAFDIVSVFNHIDLAQKYKKELISLLKNNNQNDDEKYIEFVRKYSIIFTEHGLLTRSIDQDTQQCIEYLKYAVQYPCRFTGDDDYGVKIAPIPINIERLIPR